MRLKSCMALALVLTLTAACGNDDKEQRVTVFAAASLTEAFTELETTLDFPVTYNFGGSGALATQVEQGAPVDVIATADLAPLKQLRDRNLVEPPVAFARNRLAIMVGQGNPKNIRGLADLARADVTYITEDESVPAGKYSAEILRRAGVTVSPKSKELDVKAAVAKVVAGEADATIAYVTDVRAAGARAEGVAIPDGQNIAASYGVAALRSSGNPGAARRFIRALLSNAGQRVLVAHGFTEAS